MRTKQQKKALKSQNRPVFKQQAVQILRFSIICAGFFLVWPHTAKADFRVCNETESRVGVAIGYRDEQGWISEGWWNIIPKACQVILEGDLISRYYYVHAVDYDRGGAWVGQSKLCTSDRVFTIRGSNPCKERGFNTSQFFEVDSENQRSWTIQLTDQGQTTTEQTEEP